MSEELVKPAAKLEEKKVEVAKVGKEPTMPEMMAASRKINENVKKEEAKAALAALRAKAGE